MEDSFNVNDGQIKIVAKRVGHGVINPIAVRFPGRGTPNHERTMTLDSAERFANRLMRAVEWAKGEYESKEF